MPQARAEILCSNFALLIRPENKLKFGKPVGFAVCLFLITVYCVSSLRILVFSLQKMIANPTDEADEWLAFRLWRRMQADCFLILK